MRRLLMIFGGIIVALLLFVGCSEKTNVELLISSWYKEGYEAPAFILYDDGICEIGSEYELGEWEILNGNQLKLFNYYGETKLYTILDISNDCLTLEDENTGETIQYWNDSKQTFASDELTDEKHDVTNEITKLEGLHIYFCSNGVSWIKWEDDEENKHYGFMKLNGEIYYELDSKFNAYEIGQIKDGYTYVQSNGNFALLDTKGKITYQDINENDDNFYYILASGDGLFLVKKITSNISEKIEKIGVIDASGKWVVEPIVSKDFITDEIFKQKQVDEEHQYCGEGVFSVSYKTNGANTNLFISALKQNIFEISNIGRITHFHDGILLCQSFDGGMSGGYYGKIKKITINGAVSDFPIDGKLISFTEGHVVIALESKSYQYDRLKIYDTEGGLEKDLSEYSAYSSYTPYFENGYLMFLVNGADGLLYIATIDSVTMDFSFEPVVIENMFTVFYENQAIVILKDGDSACINLKTGEQIKLPFNVPERNSYSNSVNASIYEGVISLEESSTRQIRFYNWNGEEIIPIFK